MFNLTLLGVFSKEEDHSGFEVVIICKCFMINIGSDFRNLGEDFRNHTYSKLQKQFRQKQVFFRQNFFFIRYMRNI